MCIASTFSYREANNVNEMNGWSADALNKLCMDSNLECLRKKKLYISTIIKTI